MLYIPRRLKQPIHYIEKTVFNIPKEYRVKVATNDGLEQTIIMGKGAIRITAAELKQMIEHEEKNIRQNYTEKRPGQKIICSLIM